MSLLDDLKRGEAETAGVKPCSLCQLILETEDEETREALRMASAGTIGIRKLYAILQQNETGVGQRTVTRHRNEGHMQ